MPSLRADTLVDCAERLPVPDYDRSRLEVGVVHFGVGGFHRAHQAMYHDRLMSQGQGRDWAICGVGVMPNDRRMKEVLDAQDGLYTLVEKHRDGTYEPNTELSFRHGRTLATGRGDPLGLFRAEE